MNSLKTLSNLKINTERVRLRTCPCTMGKASPSTNTLVSSLLKWVLFTSENVQIFFLWGVGQWGAVEVIPLFTKSKISSHWSSSIDLQSGLYRPWSTTLLILRSAYSPCHSFISAHQSNCIHPNKTCGF